MMMCRTCPNHLLCFCLFSFSGNCCTDSINSLGQCNSSAIVLQTPVIQTYFIFRIAATIPRPSRWYNFFILGTVTVMSAHIHSLLNAWRGCPMKNIVYSLIQLWNKIKKTFICTHEKYADISRYSRNSATCCLFAICLQYWGGHVCLVSLLHRVCGRIPGVVSRLPLKLQHLLCLPVQETVITLAYHRTCLTSTSHSWSIRLTSGEFGNQVGTLSCSCYSSHKH